MNNTLKTLGAFALSAACIGCESSALSPEQIQYEAKLAEARENSDKRLQKWLEKAGISLEDLMEGEELQPEEDAYEAVRNVKAIEAVADRIRSLPSGFSEQELQILIASQRIVVEARIRNGLISPAAWLATEPGLLDLADAVDSVNADNTDAEIAKGITLERVQELFPKAESVGAVREWASLLAERYRERVVGLQSQKAEK